MRTLLTGLAIAILISHSAEAQNQGQLSGWIGGALVHDRTSSPARGIELELIEVRVRADDNVDIVIKFDPPRSVTDDAGRFAFNQVPAGTYVIREKAFQLRMEDFLTFTMGSEHTKLIKLRPGETLDLGRIRLIKR